MNQNYLIYGKKYNIFVKDENKIHTHNGNCGGGCEECNNHHNNQNNAKSQKLWIPPYSQINKISENSVILTPPAEYVYIGYDSDNSVSRILGGLTISCTCTAGAGGCNPFWVDNSYGCNASACDKCSIVITHGTKRIINGGFVNVSEAPFILPVNTKRVPSVFSAMLQLNEFNDSIKTLIERLYKGAPVPAVREENGSAFITGDYVFALVSICGRVAAIPIPHEVARVCGLENATKFTCTSCSGGTCKFDSHWSGLKYCVNTGCTNACSLVVSRVSNGNEVILQQSLSYEF